MWSFGCRAIQGATLTSCIDHGYQHDMGKYANIAPDTGRVIHGEISISAAAWSLIGVKSGMNVAARQRESFDVQFFSLYELFSLPLPPPPPPPPPPLHRRRRRRRRYQGRYWVAAILAGVSVLAYLLSESLLERREVVPQQQHH